MININEIITSDRIKNALDCLPKNKCIYYKSDFLFNEGNWRGNHIYKYDFTSNILVIGHSDIETNTSVTDILLNTQPSLKIFSQNGTSPNCIPLPLGITNDCDDSGMHKVYGKLEIMVEVAKEHIEKTKICYLNIYAPTHSSRYYVNSKFSKYDWVTYENPICSFEARANFLRQIRAHHFVICPRGGGIDTHRLWETLYEGSIPIVIYENNYRLLVDLPILFINNWDEVTKELLEKTLVEFKTKTWNMDKLNLSYWVNLILNDV